MGEVINSVCFQENLLSWVQLEVNGSQSVKIKRAVETPLPFVINFDNLQKSSTALQIANRLRSIFNEVDTQPSSIRLLLSARFGLVKKIRVDHYVPEHEFRSFARHELNYVLASDARDYSIYLPDYDREEGLTREIMAVALRKDIIAFVQEIAGEARVELAQIAMNCFSIDELYRRFFPNLIGQSLLVNFTERGYEMVVSDENHFLTFEFKPYTWSLKSIEELEERDIFAAFSNRLEELQRPGELDGPLYSVSQAYLYGSYFKAHWLEKLQNQCSIPLRILNPTDTTEWQILTDDRNFTPLEAHRFVEPLSNIF